MRPRDYQKIAIRAIWDAIAVRLVKATVCAMPTGTGKSVVIGDLLANIVRMFPGQRVLMATDSQILVDQNADKLLQIDPDADLGIVCAGLNKKQYGHRITYAGIQSIFRYPALLGKINILVVDECHAVNDVEDTMFQQLITGLKKSNPNLIIIGLSATPYRMGMGMLTDGDTFTDVCIDMTTPEWIAWFVAEGYLVPLYAEKTQAFIDTSDVKIVAGDYQKSGVSNAAMKADMSERAIHEALPILAARKSIAIYTTSIEHTEQVVLVLDSMGIDCVYVHSKRKPDENAAALAKFGAGECRYIVSMGQLTKGWDCPRLDAEIILRPTRSPSMWVQILGRGTRPFYNTVDMVEIDGVWQVPDLNTREGRLAAIANSQKRDCLVLDFARNTEDIGPFDDPQLPRKRGAGGGEAIMKTCEDEKLISPEHGGCGAYNWPAAKFCVRCKEEFRFELKFDSTTSGQAIMKGVAPKGKPVEVPPIVRFAVSRVTSVRHQKLGKPDSMKVSYYCGIKRFTTYLCPEHGGGATARAKTWWREHIGGIAPLTTNEWEARIGEARVPSAISVRMKKDYPDVVGFHFDDQQGTQ